MSDLRKTIFMADLHLDKAFPDALKAFEQYFECLVLDSIDAVYILGDLFEYWLGDDCCDKTGGTVARVLSHYSNVTGVPIYYIHGNRDFLLGDDYARRCSMKILSEVQVINLYGIKTLILHGDTLCTDDIEYQQFREIVRSESWQQKVLRWPKWIRKLKAKQLRRKSKKANSQKSDIIMDVAQASVEELMRRNDVFEMIHGHTHRPAIHEFSFDGCKATRSVVGDWYTQCSVLVVSSEGKELVSWSL
ncbi:MAG: UDP-2,3-diacylglucosamine diphosphatase [Gammaproteobacteria bacterium]|nr:UDP-2,3-diacylglucosamine diphosphatase [Gammaproteobacteria bacterium]